MFFGLQGLWQESMDTLALTLATVVICVLIGLPLGIWAGVNDRVERVITPVLDFLQTMPSYVYLAPIALFFLIGPASAVIVTFIYAVPPIVRITAHGIRDAVRDVLSAEHPLRVCDGDDVVGVVGPAEILAVIAMAPAVAEPVTV